MALVAAVVALRRQRSGSYESREVVLERRVKELESTVTALMNRTVRDQKRIEELENALATAQRKIEHLEMQLGSRQAAGQAAPAGQAAALLVALGADALLGMDLAVLREVQRETGLRLTRLWPVTKANLKRALDRVRVNQQAVYLHFGVHAGPDGLEFADGVVDGVWLSEQLRGVLVVLIAGCEADRVGDLLGVVPAVVSMAEQISHEDAAVFTRVFWGNIGRGLDAQAAFDDAVDRCPPGVAEFAVFHG